MFSRSKSKYDREDLNEPTMLTVKQLFTFGGGFFTMGCIAATVFFVFIR